MNRTIKTSLALGLSLMLLADATADDAAPITYSRDIAPIFIAKCVSCHRPDQIGPMSLLNYDEVRPWAKSIKSTVVEREMPPWDADPNHGKWANDISLSDDEIALVAKWVDQGAPEGNPVDHPPLPEFSAEWTIGTPDLIIDLPEMVVPADGPDLFPDQVVTVDIPEGAWLSAVEILPGDRQVLHHVVAFLGNAAMRGPNARSSEQGPTGFGAPGIAVASIWAAGTPPTINPEGMGHPLKTKQTMTFNMHYHPSGMEVVDRTRVGLRFGEGEMKKQMKTIAGVNAGFYINPGNANYEGRAYYRFDADSRIVTFFPHMHLRGKHFEYRLTRPDGSTETLLKVPGYNFEWQWVYYPEVPVAAPAGSIMEIYGIWDNSDANVNNPDPDSYVGFGEETGDEMLIGFMDIVPEDGVAFSPSDPKAGLAEYLSLLESDQKYMIQFGGMFPVAVGALLPDDGGNGAFYIQTPESMVVSEISNLEWTGDKVTGEVVLLGFHMEIEGTLAADDPDLISIRLGVPDVESLTNPQAQFMFRMLANLRGTRLNSTTRSQHFKLTP